MIKTHARVADLLGLGVVEEIDEIAPVSRACGGKLAVASRDLATSAVEAAKTQVGLGSKSPVPLVTGTKCVPLYVCLSLFM